MIGAVIFKVSVHRRSGDSAPAHLRERLPDLRAWKSYYIESSTAGEQELGELARMIADVSTERVEIGEGQRDGEVQVSYKQGIVDNENDSVVELCQLAGLDATAARLATTYASSDPRLSDEISRHVCNFTIEDMHTSEPRFATLGPKGSYEPARRFDLRPMSDAQLVQVGADNGSILDLEKMRKIQALQRAMDAPDVSDALLEALDARWSDHCAHTTWKSLGSLLKRLMKASTECNNPNVVSMFHDNAGIWRFYDGWALAIKAETHNGPTAVSAYFGQLTKVGGVLRDILGTGKGADPIGVYEYTATGVPGSPSPVEGRPEPSRIANETIRAIKEYGNTFGVPMMASRMAFHPDYRAKPFALGGSVGVIPMEHADKGVPLCGDLVMLIGGLTGDDGIHGGSSSSAGGEMTSTAVQIGSPLEEIKFREAIIDLRDAGCIRAITDLGAAGINSAAGEIGESTGIFVNTALVPLKTAGLPMWRVLLSESQERMMLAIAPESLAIARRILTRHDVRNTVIGRFTDTARYCVLHDPSVTEDAVVALPAGDVPHAEEVGFDVPYELLDYDPDPLVVDAPGRSNVATEWPSVVPIQLAELMPSLLADPEVCSQAFASLQYDSSVQGRTLYGPNFGKELVPTTYYASRPVYGHDGALVLTTAFDPWLFAAHPVRAARQMLVSALTKQVLAGVRLEDICLADNFYTPNMTDDGYGWLVAMVDELVLLSKAFGTPFISGKDSSAGSTRTAEGVISVPPAVYISALGKVPSGSVLRPDVPGPSRRALVQIGVTTPSPAATVGARLLGAEAEHVDDVPLEDALGFLRALQDVPPGLIEAGRAIGPGGFAVTAALMSLACDRALELGAIDGPLAEHRCSALVLVDEQRVTELPGELSARLVGTCTGVTGASVTYGGAQLLSNDAVHAWRTSFEGMLS